MELRSEDSNLDEKIDYRFLTDAGRRGRQFRQIAVAELTYVGLDSFAIRESRNEIAR